MGNTRECEQIRENLAAVVDGDIEPSLQEHLASCDDCRDLRHDARVAMDSVAASGADYLVPADLEARLLAVLDARQPETAVATTAATPTEKELASVPTTMTTAAVATASATPTVAAAGEIPRTLEMPVTPAMKLEADAPSAAVSKHPSVGGSDRVPGVVIPLRGRRGLWLATGIAVVAAAAAAPFFIRDTATVKPPLPVAQHGPAQLAWQGRLAAVARASADRVGGVEVRLAGSNSFVAMTEGQDVPAGAEVRTDARTRARVDIADGTHLVLDRGTSMRFERELPRSATLVAGGVVADVAHIAGVPNARFALPNGGVTVVGTKFALTAGADRSTVRVTRGTVRLADAHGQEIEVKTGQEGVLTRDTLPEVAPAMDLADSVAWSEIGDEARVEPDAPVVGLGELRARRPGQTDERDHQVSLNSHSVRVRIVGNMARTEIEETFRNDTAHELEGIYRFPLPPEAQIEKLALDVRGQMEEGAFVDRQRAAAIWRGVIRNAVHPIQRQQQTEELVWVPGPWRDPALLEWQRGGRFELRVFPIPAHGTRRVAIAYTQTIAASGGVRRYVYPLAHDANGSTRVAQFDVDVQVLGNDHGVGVHPRGYPLVTDTVASPGGGTHLAFEQSAFVPAGDLVIEYALPNRADPVTAWAFQPSAPEPGASIGGIAANAQASAHAANRGTGTATAPTAASAASAGLFVPSSGPEASFVAIALRPTLPRWTDSNPRDYAIIVDASRSMVGERLARASRLARGMVAEMDPRDRVVVLACDTVCRAMPGGLQFAGGSVARSTETFLASEEPMGASDLIAQVRAATALLGRTAGRDARIVYLGDGAATVGYRRPDMVAAEIAEAMPPSGATLTAVAIGGDADTTLLGAMARAGGGAMVPYVPGESLSTAALSVLEATYGVTLRDPTLTLPDGLTELAPARIPTIRAGSETIVVARMSAARVSGEAVLRGTVGGEAFEARFPLTVVATTNAGNSFVPRLFAATRIADLEAQPGDAARSEIVQLSQRFHVASRFTSLLVLESDAMYRAFGVRRNEGGSVVWTGEEASVATAVPAPPSADPRDIATLALAANGAAPSDGAAPSEEAPGSMQAASRNRGEPGGGEAEAGMAGLGDSDDVAGVDRLPNAPGGLGSIGTSRAGGGGMGMGSSSGMSVRGRSAERDETSEAAPREQPVANAGPMAERRSRPMAQQAPAAPVAATGTTTSTPFQARPPSRSTGARAEPQRVVAPDQARRRPGRWMRRIWVRRGAISLDRNARSGERSHIDSARLALQAVPDSKTRHADLYRWLSVAGELDEARDVATRWSTRDALDPDALTRLSDAAARRGAREQAIRILSGIVDVRPDDVAGHKRLAVLFERAGQTAQACAFRVAMAQVRTTDADVLADAIRCERVLGHSASAARLLGAVVEDSLRRRVEIAASTVAPASSGAPRGDIVVDANWDAPVDLDVAIIDTRGNRLSWLGGRASGLGVRGATDPRAEAIGLSRGSVGDYVIEVSRTSADRRIVRGQIELRVLGENRTVSFVLMPTDSNQRVARASITREEQMVETDVNVLNAPF